MMKIKLLKNHMLGKQGDIVNINFFRGKYLISEGIALEQKQARVDDDEEDFKVEFKIDTNELVGVLDKEEKKATEKIVNNGSNTKKRATRKRKTNAKS